MEIKKNKITVVLGINKELNVDENLEHENRSIKEYISEKFENLSDKKIDEALKICLLKEEDKEKKISNLSSNELEKLKLCIKLLKNDSTISLNFFEHVFLIKELNYFKSLFKKMVKKYNKTVVIFTNKLDRIMDCFDILIVLNQNQQVVLETNDIYDDKIYNFIETPEIIEFVKFLKNKNIKMEKYTDRKELLKAIYRSVA